MPSDDELRRVAEDVRALARSLGRDIRTAVDRARDDAYGPSGAAGSSERRSAREDLAAAGREARYEWRQARRAIRHAAQWRGYGGYDSYGYGGGDDGVENRAVDDDPDGDGASGGEGRDEAEGGGPVRSPWGPGPGCPPRWDNWGHHRYHEPAEASGRARRGSRRSPVPPRATVSDQAPVVAPVPDPAPPLRHRHDGSTVLGLLAVVFGLAWLIAGTRLAQVSTEAVVAIALMVLGAATVVTARSDWALSRRSWPVMVGAVMAVALLALSASSSLPVRLSRLQFGSRTITPATWAEVPATIQGGVGRTVVNLAGLPTPLTVPQSLTVDGVAGGLEIDLPANLKVLLATHVTAGRIAVNDVATSGVRQIDNEVLDPGATGPALTLQVQAGFGSVVITQAPVGPTKPVLPGGSTPKTPPAPTPPTP